MLQSRRILKVATLAIGIVGLVGSAAPTWAQKLDGVTIGSGSVGGDFYLMGTAMQQVLSEAHPGAKVENTVTAGSVENLRLLRRKDIDVGIFTITGNAIKDAWNGRKAFEKEKPYTELRNLAGFFHFIYHVITLADSDIKTYADLMGKRISVGPDPNINDATYSPFIMANGLDYFKLDKVYMSYGDAFRLLGEGRVDASITWSSGFKLPPAVQELAASKKLRWLPQSRQGLIDAKLEVVEFPAGSLPHLTADQVAPKYGLVAIATTKDMSDDTAYAIVKTLHKRFDQFAQLQPAIQEAGANPETLTANTDPVPYHPGAIRYWKEAGLWKR